MECEVHEREVHEKHVPKEFLDCPVEAYQGIYDETIHNGLEEDVWNLNYNLLKS